MSAPSQKPSPGKNPALIAVAVLVMLLAVILSKAKHADWLGEGSLRISFGVIAIAAFCWALYYLRKK